MERKEPKDSNAPTGIVAQSSPKGQAMEADANYPAGRCPGRSLCKCITGLDNGKVYEQIIRQIEAMTQERNRKHTRDHTIGLSTHLGGVEKKGISPGHVNIAEGTMVADGIPSEVYNDSSLVGSPISGTGSPFIYTLQPPALIPL